MEQGNAPRRVLLQGRKIDVDAFDIGNGILLLSGSLFDRRDRPIKSVFGTYAPAGVIQAMGLEIEVRLSDFTIVRAHATMLHAPLPECNEVVPIYDALVGLKVTRGFNAEVRQLFKGRRGCAHLTSLALTMAPMAAQGAEATTNDDAPLSTRVDSLFDTCHTFRSDGAVIKRAQPTITAPSSEGRVRT